MTKMKFLATAAATIAAASMIGVSIAQTVTPSGTPGTPPAAPGATPQSGGGAMQAPGATSAGTDSSSAGSMSADTPAKADRG